MKPINGDKDITIIKRPIHNSDTACLAINDQGCLFHYSPGSIYAPNVACGVRSFRVLDVVKAKYE